MATVFTTTQTNPLAYPTLPPIARDQSNGNLYALGFTATDTLTLYRSTDSGGSWGSYAAFTHTGLQEWSSIVVDKYGYAHLAYRVGASSVDTIWYRRCNLSSASWSSGLQVSGSDANGGVNGSVWQGVDLAVVRHSNGTYAICVVGAYTQGTTRYGMVAGGVSIDGSGTIYLNHGIITNNRFWLTSGTAPGRSGVTCELEHNGDGISAGTPNLWVAWGRTTLYMVKLAWQGTATGWQGPTNYQTIRTGITAQNYAGGRWDSTQWLMPVISPSDSTMVRVYQRNRANTLTSTFDTPTHPTGVIRQFAVSYDNSTKNIRVFAVGTSTTVLYFVDYVRATSTWGTWATVTATAVLGSAGDEWGVRRGGSSGNARHDVLTAASGAPNVITHTAQTVSSTPAVPVWDTSTVPYLNGGAADVGASLTLDWLFSDPDPGQGQGSYAISRQIGAGALNYWRASDSTWQVAEVQNASATTALTLASGWAAGTDASYTFKVKVWDSGGTPQPSYSTGLVLVPSVKVNPSISTPTAAQVLATDTVTMTWTASEQTGRRVRLMTNPGSVVVYDSGFVADAGLSFTVPYRMGNGTGWTIELTTKNSEGLASTAQTRNFTVAYSAAPAVLSTFTPQPTLGYITFTPAALSPVGTQPSIAAMDLYRRAAITPTLNSNPDMGGNVAGWAYTGGGTPGTISYSTTQFRNGPGALRYVPPASGAASPQAEQSTSTTIVAGSLYVGRAWIRPDTANKPIFVQLNWYTSGDVFISSTQYAISAPVATAWQYLEVTGDPATVPTAAKVRVAVGESSTPAASDGYYADDVELHVFNPDPGVRIAQGLAADTVVNDWGAPSGTALEYRWIVSGSNGTTISSPWLT